jgi:hypothetical protein
MYADDGLAVVVGAGGAAATLIAGYYPRFPGGLAEFCRSVKNSGRAADLKGVRAHRL